MSDATQLLNAIEAGEPQADELLAVNDALAALALEEQARAKRFEL